MSTFTQLCQAVADKRKGYTYNWGQNYIGITFNDYKSMWAFMKTEEYKELRKFRILTKYTKFLYFENK